MAAAGRWRLAVAVRLAAWQPPRSRVCFGVRGQRLSAGPSHHHRWLSVQAEVANSASAETAQPVSMEKLKRLGAQQLNMEEKKRRRRALDHLGIRPFAEFVKPHAAAEGRFARRATKTLQINIGLHCNQACNHCHVESSPQRTEMMDRRTADRVLELLSRTPSIDVVDITGGAPELNKEFRYVADRVHQMGRRLIDRCNLTVLLLPEQKDLASFLADRQVHIVASLPFYSKKNVTKQRGKGVFDASIEALRLLNSIGYGKPDSPLKLDLVHNPVGAFLPPNQQLLEAKYREELRSLFGVEFNSLFTMTNMPIKRFADYLHRKGELEHYMTLLVSSFNAATLDGLMCRDLVSVSWDGQLFDCDFNQMLDIPLGAFASSSSSAAAATQSTGSAAGPTRQHATVFDVDSFDALTGGAIATDSHCFGCTAGAGSS